MSNSASGSSKTLLYILVIGGLIAIVEGVLQIGHSASLLFSLVFWTSIVEGCIALVAATETSSSPWIKPIKKELLSVYPLILLCAVLFGCLYPRLDLYPWHDLNGKWLNKSFFMTRNIGMLLVVFLLARKYASESLKESESKTTWSVLYLFAFVTSQSLVAFDWVMSMEYPWVSTLFGGYFFMESIYIGLAFAGILIYILSKRSPDKLDYYKKALKDVATMMLGWSVLWAGLMFAQYLTIWYGHLPEESSFFINRLAQPYYKVMMFVVLILMFLIPFTSLISKKIKTNPTGILIISLVILIGYTLEKVVFLWPLVNINTFLVILEYIGFAILAFSISLSASKSTDKSS